MRRITPIPLNFDLAVSPEKKVTRQVCAFAVLGKDLCLIDTGTAANEADLGRALARMDRQLSEIQMVIHTHAHPDHIGCNARLAELASPTFAAHPAAARWIENPDTHCRERAVHNFHEMVGGAVSVKNLLQDGQILDLGDITLQIIYTPGHSKGSVSFFCLEEETLIAGDAVPQLLGIPLYVDLDQSRASLEKLLNLKGVHRLYTSLSPDPIEGNGIQSTLEEGLAYLDRMTALVKATQARMGGETALPELTAEVLRGLGLDPPPVMPMTLQTIAAHL
ncbi:MAG: MBL fold metallo-hydrolase [Deltaproteobacteria bacterium]|nr:MBL fold metallo-hydrolase [Deltaproteobacteria bacterium]